MVTDFIIPHQRGQKKKKKEYGKKRLRLKPSQNKSIFCSEHLNALMKHDRMLSHLRSPTRNTNPPFPSSSSHPEPIPENPTNIPEPLLATLTPILLIRHPALTIPSSWRTESGIKKLDIDDEDFYLLTTNRWSRDLLTYLLHQSTNSSDNSSGWRKPLVIDAYDVVHRTAQLTGRLCGELGLDPAGVQESWRKLPREEWPGHSVVVAYTRDLLGSGGVERGVGKVSGMEFMSENGSTLLTCPIAIGGDFRH